MDKKENYFCFWILFLKINEIHLRIKLNGMIPIFNKDWTFLSSLEPSKLKMFVICYLSLYLCVLSTCHLSLYLTSVSYIYIYLLSIDNTRWLLF